MSRKEEIEKLLDKVENAFEKKFGISLDRYRTSRNPKGEVTESYYHEKFAPSVIPSAQELHSEYHTLELAWQITFNFDDVQLGKDQLPVYCWFCISSIDIVLLDENVSISTTYYAEKDEWDKIEVSL